MPHFFSSFFKKQKKYFLLILSGVFALLSLPQIAYAIVDEIVAYLIQLMFYTPAFVLTWIWRTIAQIIVEITGKLVAEYVQNPRLITQNNVYLASWSAVRDFANMLLVLALIGCAVAII